jgi:hypothetical protein
MNTSKFLILFVMLLFLGCSAIRIKDTVPKNSPKGFVEFYYPVDLEWVGASPRIYMYENNKVIKFGYLPHRFTVFQYKLSFRISLSPGIHIFIVKLGNAQQEIKINIEEGKLIPIRIRTTIIESREARVGYPGYILFNLILTAEEQISINDVLRK